MVPDLNVLLVQIGGVQVSASWITALACDLGPAGLPGASPMLLMTVGITDGAVALHGAPASEVGSRQARAALERGSVTRQLLPRLLVLQQADLEAVTCLSTMLWAPHGSGKPHRHPCCTWRSFTSMACALGGANCQGSQLALPLPATQPQAHRCLAGATGLGKVTQGMQACRASA